MKCSTRKGGHADAMRSWLLTLFHPTSLFAHSRGRLLAPLLVLLCCQVRAEAWGQGNITLSVKDVPVEQVFRELKKQSGYSFVYPSEILSRLSKITLTVRKVSLEEVLNQVFKGSVYTYSIIDKVVVIKRDPALTQRTSQSPAAVIPIDITGKVTNEKGEPLPGVTVTVKGTDRITSTDVNGAFSITSVDREAILLFSSVNMEPFELKVSGQSDLAIRMRAKVRELEDVTINLNTGYQKINKERFVGSVSALDSASYHRRAGMNILDRLDGTVPGVLFDKKSSTSLIQIRGISTLQGNESPSPNPLIIVDNFPFTGSLDNINPNDIESITVLKDAAAASIWGTRAGNGVIVITTKKGNFGQPFRVTLSSNITVSDKPDLYYFPTINSSDFIDLEQTLFDNEFYNSALNNTRSRPVISPVVEILAKKRSGLISGEEAAQQINALRNVDYRDDLDHYVYRHKMAHQYHLNLSGGNNLLNYTFSAGYNYTQPGIKGSRSDDQYTISSAAIFRPVKNLEMESGINYTRGQIKSTDLNLPSKIYPYMDFVSDDGSSLAVPKDHRMSFLASTGNGELQDWMYRPIDEIKLADNDQSTQFIRLNLRASYKFFPWLSGEIKYQFINEMINKDNHYSLKSYEARHLINLYTNLNETDPDLRHPIPVGGILDHSQYEASSHNIRTQININQNWHNKHFLTGLIAAELSESQSATSANRLYGYDKETGIYRSNLNYQSFFPIYGRLAGSSGPIPNGSAYLPGAENRIISLLSNLSYTYEKKYTFYGSLRRDGANVFGVNTNNKWKPLWSVGGSWEISNERFYNIKWLSALRLRTSLGYMGNVNNFLSGLPTIYYSNPASFTNLPSSQIGNAPNPDLRWEQVSTINWGMDFKLFNNRISASFDFFLKKSTDVISNIPFDPTSGVSEFVVNYASLKTRGFDLSIHSINTAGKIRWESTLGLSHAKTVITNVGFNELKASSFLKYGVQSAVGKVAYGIGSYRWAGLDPLTGDPQGIFNSNTSKDYFAIYNDSVDNQVFHGSAVPLYFGFLTNAVSWKGLTLSANITYRFDFYYRRPSLNYTTLYTNWLGHEEYNKRWQKTGDEKVTHVPSMPYPADSYRDLFYNYSSINVLRGDNIRLQDIRLQYVWTKQHRKLPFQSLQLFIYANNLNLIIWKADNSEYDPDFTGGAESSIQIPSQKLWTGGFIINF